MSIPLLLSKPVAANNVFGYLSETCIHGKPNKTMQQVLEFTYKRIEDEFESVPTDGPVNSIFKLLKELEQALLPWNLNQSKVLPVLSNVKTELYKTAKQIVDNESREDCETALWMMGFFIHRTGEVLVAFLMSYTALPPKNAEKYESETVLCIKGIVLELIGYICFHFEDIAIYHSRDAGFMNCLFSYMQYHETCFPACRLVECLLLAKRKILDLSSIEKLHEMIIGFDDVCLGNFCKVLAITLSELDMYEHKTSLYAQTKQKKNQNFYTRDINQDFVLKVPDILSRLVNLACAKPYVPWFPSASVESGQWMNWIENQFTGYLACDNLNPDFIGGVTQWSDPDFYGSYKTSIKITCELTYRADAVCVLGLLLVGRHRKEVQKELANLQLIPQLSDLFDHFLWQAHSGPENARLPGHTSSCECSPDVALKIQVLRLIHSFCDHSDYKHVMLSWSEYSELKSLEESSGPSSTSSSLRLTKNVLCVGIKGLLSKICEILKDESKASTFRFWLSRAIESYLRGSISTADQNFLLRRNLLQHVVESLMTSSVRNKEVLQSSFDLLGELVKFNINSFQELNSQLHSVARHRKLLSLMNASLIDSNMFIRSLILSYEHFTSSEDVDMKGYAEKHFFLLCHVSSLKNRIRYLRKLLCLINIHNLTQENVSCLNTALVILMFGLKKNELPQYLHYLAFSTNEHSGLLDNLKDLLLFWKDHYLQKDKDCTVLEKSSRISFQEWRDIVSLLISEDSLNPCSIAFYTVAAVSSRAC